MLVYTHLGKVSDNILHFKHFVGKDGVGVSAVERLGSLGLMLSRVDTYLGKLLSSPVRGFLTGVQSSRVSKEAADRTKQDVLAAINRDGLFMNQNTQTPIRLEKVDDSGIIDKLLAVRTNVRMQISSIFGIPPSYLGLPGNQGGDLSLVFQSFITNCVSPIARSIGDGFTLKLLSKTQRRNGYSIVFQLDKALLSKLQDKVTTAAALVGGGLGSVNEARSLIGLKPRTEDECNQVMQDKPNNEAVQNLINENANGKDNRPDRN